MLFLVHNLLAFVESGWYVYSGFLKAIIYANPFIFVTSNLFIIFY